MQQVILERASFKSLVDSDQPVTEEEIVAWLSDPRDIELEVGDNYSAETHPAYSTTIEDYPSVGNFTVFNLDPASAAVLIAGLSAILAWVSTERRHKETLASKPPGSSGTIGVDDPELCRKVEAGRRCRLPLSNTMRVKGENFLILFRACKKRPEPHTTVEYYEL